jgi:methylated-DNA-[protein]-cysteine S-methyltransferase
MAYVYKWINTTVGPVKVIADTKILKALLWKNSKELALQDSMTEDNNHPILCATESQLNEFFAGQRASFDVPLDPQGTVFQKDVWKALSEIPFGVTVSYSFIAQKIGRPKAVRAVGTAIGKNPYSIIIPCHRVIGMNGELTGFGGGLAVKQKLLDVEASFATDSSS